MKFSGTKRVIIEHEKIEGYCLYENHPDNYEIEFVDENGQTKALVTLPGSDVMRLNLNIAATT